ncbi:MAG TPA: hypothetical protein VFB62_11640, partial [Polyangiaceae bacterium]|nr:hypothetical protein [Polyangiaceae bacterium]
VEGSAIRNMLPDAEVGGRGISGQAYLMTGAPATLVVSSSLVEQNQDFGVFAEGSNVTLDASVVRATQPNAQGSFGRGVGLQAHATTPSSLLMHGSLIEQNQQIGVALSGSTASLETSVIRGSLRGVNAQPDETTTAPSQLSMLGVLVEQSLEAGVATLGSDATLDACIVRATTGGPDGRYGNGVMVISELRPASVAISASRVEQSLLAAVAVWGARAAIRGSALVCQAYDLDSESYDGSPAVLDDLGDNVCGCPEPTSSCKAVSAGLEPPAPLD